MAHLTAQDVDQALTDETIREATVIHLAMTGGVVLFAGVIVFLALTGDNEPTDAPHVDVLSGLVGLLFLSGAALAAFVFRFMLAPARLGATGDDDGAALAARALEKHRAASIVRLALLEGAALFGLVVAMLAVKAGMLPQQPVYALNTVPALVMIVVGAATVPTRDRIVSTVVRNIGG